jgi:O-antigen ligase
LLAALGVLVWTTAAVAASPATSLLRTGIWTTHLFFGLAIVNLWRLGMFDFAAHIQATLCGFLIFFAMLVVFIATTEQTALERISDLPAFSNIRWFGYYAAAVIGFSVSGFVQQNRLALFAATMAFAMAFWTGTRGTVAASAVGLFASTILFREFRSFRSWLLFASCGLAGFVVALGLDSLLALGDQGPSSMGRYNDSGRIEVWRASLQLIQVQPWFGHGDGQFKLPVGETLIIAQPHNIVLQILHAWGIIGGLLCLALVIRTAPSFLASKSLHSAPFRCGALILGAYSFIDGALFYNQSLSLFALCCSAAVASGLPAERDPAS